MTRNTRLIGAAVAVAMLAWPAAANQLLNERWLATASYEQVQKVIAGGADVDAARSGYTPLMVASRAGNHDAIRALCEAGADGNRPAKPGQHGPLHFAAGAEVVALLFDCGALVWAPNSNGMTPLHYAAEDNRAGAMEALIGRGADPDARTGQGRTPLHIAARYGHLEAAQVLLAGGADPNAATPQIGNTPLHLMAGHGEAAAVRILIAAGADVNARNRSDVTPLYTAAKNNIPEVVQVLLDAGADPAIHANTRFDSSLVPEPAEVAKAENPKVARHPVMARLEAAAAGTTPASPSADPATPGCDGYIVQATDRRLGDVAEKMLGDRSRWTEIARLNGISAENPHRVGQCLALP